MKSRETTDSMWSWLAKRRQRQAMRPMLAAAVTTSKLERIHTSRSSRWKACTDWMSPVRVVHVARMVNQNVAAARPSAQCLKTPRDLYRVKECSSAVAVSHGTSDVFSTGSQAQ